MPLFGAPVKKGSQKTAKGPFESLRNSMSSCRGSAPTTSTSSPLRWKRRTSFWSLRLARLNVLASETFGPQEYVKLSPFVLCFMVFWPWFHTILGSKCLPKAQNCTNNLTVHGLWAQKPSKSPLGFVVSRGPGAPNSAKAGLVYILYLKVQGT